MNKKMYLLVAFLVAISLALSACSPAAAPTHDPMIDSVLVSSEQQATSQAQTNQVLAAIATQLAQPTALPPTAVPAAVPTVDSAAASAAGTTQSSDWVLTWLPTASKDRGNGTTFKQDAEKWIWRRIAPELWREFPNVPNLLVPDFRNVPCADDPSKWCVPDGIEYAMNESNFCQQLAGEACRYPVAAGHVLFYSGDYSKVPELGACAATKEFGCEMAIVNVGDVSSDFTSVFQQGFRLHQRFFNGDTLNMGIWALMSNGASNMMNMSSNLNPQGFTNGGANCSVRTGCPGVDARILFVSGNEPLLMLTTQVSRP